MEGSNLSKRMWYAALLVFVIFLIFFLTASVIISERNKKDYIERESEILLTATSSAIEGNISNYKDLSRLVMLDEDVVAYLSAKEDDQGLKLKAHYSSNNILNVSSNVDSLFIFRNDNGYMSTGRGEYILDWSLLYDEFWKYSINSKKGAAVIYINGNGAVYRKNYKPILTIARTINDIYTQRKIGILLMNISGQMLENVISERDYSDICILYKDGTYLAGDSTLKEYYDPKYYTTTPVHQMHFEGLKRVMISGRSVDEMPLIIICRATAGSEYVPVDILITLFIILLCFLALMLASGYFITKNITNPINELSSAMEKTKETGYLERIDIHIPNNEIGMLADSYNRMIDNLNLLFNELIEKEKSVQKAELRVLQEQIKPHFLYNSIETISFMALDSGAEEVHKALETLGSFYRNFLSKGDREIPLNREIEIVKDYLTLQKLRYGDILDDVYHIDERALNIMVPKLILQPLVENSIYHGIRLTGEKGIIRITATIAGDELHIIVYDTGVGMDEYTIRKILNQKNTSGDYDGRLHGFGLSGTIERVRYYCNKDDVVTIKSEQGEYTEIEMILPITRKE